MCISTKRRLKRRVRDLEDALADANVKLESAAAHIGILERIGESKDSAIFGLKAEAARLKAENGDYEVSIAALTSQVASLNAELSKTPARGKDGRYIKRTADGTPCEAEVAVTP